MQLSTKLMQIFEVSLLVLAAAVVFAFLCGGSWCVSVSGIGIVVLGMRGCMHEVVLISRD